MILQGRVFLQVGYPTGVQLAKLLYRFRVCNLAKQFPLKISIITLSSSGLEPPKMERERRGAEREGDI